MHAKPSFITSAGPLLLVIFIDGMGLGLAIPILNGLIFEGTFLPPAFFTPVMKNIIYGLIIGIFMLCWFFGAAILGDLSDKIGRKKSLLICLFGSFLSYLLSGFAVSINSLTLIIVGRVVAGITSGSQPIAQAAIIDLSVPAYKTRNIGYILLALSLGFIVGPLLGGVLSDKNIISWFNFSVPFYFASLLSFLNMGLLLLLFDETFITKTTTFSINPYQAINIFVSAFRNENIRVLSILFFIFIFGWSSYYSFIAMYLFKIYEFTPTQVSLFMAVMGIGFGVGNGYLANYCARLFPLRINFIYATLISGVLIFLMLCVPYVLFSWFMVAPLAAAVSVAYTSILTLFSNQVDEKSQGWVMGVTGSVMAFVWAVNGIVVGCLAIWHDALPILLAAFSLLVTAIATVILFKESKNIGSQLKI